MSVYIGDPPYEQACDCKHEAHGLSRGRCFASGPACFSEEEAEEKAEEEGWAIYVDDVLGPDGECNGDLCPACARDHRPAKAEETTEGGTAT